jgi:hypothetical protein
MISSRFSCHSWIPRSHSAMRNAASSLFFSTQASRATKTLVCGWVVSSALLPKFSAQYWAAEIPSYSGVSCPLDSSGMAKSGRQRQASASPRATRLARFWMSVTTSSKSPPPVRRSRSHCSLAYMPQISVMLTEVKVAIFLPLRLQMSVYGLFAATATMLRSVLYLPKTVAGSPVASARSGTS